VFNFETSTVGCCVWVNEEEEEVEGEEEEEEEEENHVTYLNTKPIR
jgi:hypothetical protein